MHRLRCSWVLSLWLVIGSAVQAAEPPLRVCLNDVPHPPWRMASPDGRIQRQGLDFLFLDRLAQRSGLAIEISLLPWKRCLADLKSGAQDAVLSLSYLAEREEFVVYPTRKGEPDTSMALRHNRYHWYAARPLSLRWDGEKLRGLPAGAVVGVQTGYSIGTVVRDLGFTVDEAARTTTANLEKLARGRVQVVALQAKEADEVLRHRPDLGRRIQRVEPVLQERAYYTAFTRSYWSQNPQRVLGLWRDVAAIRDSAEYRQAEAKALAQTPAAP
ncbi:substrate-binding periplasmic protein [Inhella gelatinilytica]|uniref:Transporter substrate-binding domain-containing protein n=1 Tax=Inhella gelatinilytica TaxID=2795030 RepID=A0A931IVZ3_9BURK|nr:transporter substrate-binding domain-containing protein [Inhella gelatinilytica]MBH9552014.1 transporter substrate-binding domain-containing protein [Inhella gelatinilytica]